MPKSFHNLSEAEAISKSFHGFGFLKENAPFFPPKAQELLNAKNHPLCNPLILKSDSMNFKGHITGGIIAGATLTVSAVALGEPLGLPAPPWVLAQIFAVTVFFSLFPDLDISSIPQRWFFRGIFVLLLVLGYYEYYEEATLLALVAITPLLDHHRSWTHHVLSALLFPVVLACLYEYLLTKNQFFQQWSFERIVFHLQTHLWLVIACIAGWYTHLFLDYLQSQKLSFKRKKRSKMALRASKLA